MLISFGLTAMLVHENYVPKPLVEKQTFRNLKTHLPEFSSLVALSATSFPVCHFGYRHLPIMTVYIKGMLPSNTENIAFISGAVFSAMGIAQFFSSSPLGKLVDRIGPRKVLIYSMISCRSTQYTASLCGLCVCTWVYPFLARFWARWYVTCAQYLFSIKTPKGNIRDKYSRTISLVCLWVTF